METVCKDYAGCCSTMVILVVLVNGIVLPETDSTVRKSAIRQPGSANHCRYDSEGNQDDRIRCSSFSVKTKHEHFTLFGIFLRQLRAWHNSLSDNLGNFKPATWMSLVATNASFLNEQCIQNIGRFPHGVPEHGL